MNQFNFVTGEIVRRNIVIEATLDGQTSFSERNEGGGQTLDMGTRDENTTGKTDFGNRI